MPNIIFQAYSSFKQALKDTTANNVSLGRFSSTDINHRKATPQRKAGGKLLITLSPSRSPRWVSTRSFWRTTQNRALSYTDTFELTLISYRQNVTTQKQEQLFYNLRKSAVKAEPQIYDRVLKRKGGTGDGEGQGYRCQ